MAICLVSNLRISGIFTDQGFIIRKVHTYTVLSLLVCFNPNFFFSGLVFIAILLGICSVLILVMGAPARHKIMELNIKLDRNHFYIRQLLKNITETKRNYTPRQTVSNATNSRNKTNNTDVLNLNENNVQQFSRGQIESNNDDMSGEFSKENAKVTIVTSHKNGHISSVGIVPTIQNESGKHSNRFNVRGAVKVDMSQMLRQHSNHSKEHK